ncbi:HAD family hydrolase [Paenibacillus harenae]|uniref:HAD family hydrolase n=1 Tax=Paenibacillus harenae TaxID=306543 RepID=UPI00278EA1B2|nr:HAD family hydrolase [Paenibacillus harenae]MDQ0063927.1 phosphoglycolate phosphatase [Paenibacillus harenae]
MAQLAVCGDMHEIDAILFDKDGTLLDFVSMWGFWSECVITAFGTELTVRGLKALDAAAIPSLWGAQHHESGRIIGYDRNGPLAMGTMADLYAVLAWQGYLAGMSWAESRSAAIRCGEEASAMLEIKRPARLLAGVKSFLDACRQQGLPIAVVTADETDAALRHLEWLGIRPYFGMIIGTDQVERGKPFGDMAELACSRLGVQPARTAVIGDTNGDMLMGRAAGAALRIALAGGTAAYPDASHIISGYEELRLGG